MDIGLHWTDLVAIGLIAQIVDGAFGVGFGPAASAFLAALGMPPAVATAAVHATQAVRSAGLAAWRRDLGRVDRAVLRSLLIPGVAGALLGSILVTQLPAAVLRPVVVVYLAVIGVRILWRAVRDPDLARSRKIPASAFGAAAGVSDSVGGGGWSSLVGAALAARIPDAERLAASVNAARLAIAVAVSVVTWGTLGFAHASLVLGLVVGTLAGMPLTPVVARNVTRRVALLSIGTAVLALTLGAGWHVLA